MLASQERQHRHTRHEHDRIAHSLNTMARRSLDSR